MDLDGIKKIHFTGIGGAGMSVLAEAFCELGKQVTGSDAKDGPRVEQLRKKGIMISVPHSDEYLSGSDMLCFSSAVSENNVERIKAQSSGILQIRRGELMAHLLSLKKVIGIAGSHGKTTTTAFLASTLLDLGHDTTLVLGGQLKDALKNEQLKWGHDTVVAETDESDGTFLYVRPEHAIITNIDHEHIEHYGEFDLLLKAFEEYFVSVKNMPVVCGDNKYLMGMVDRVGRSCITYGFSPHNDIWACEIETSGFMTSFDVVRGGQSCGRFEINLSGKHNVLNALAVIAVCVLYDYPLDKIRPALKKFTGVKRRMEIRREAAGKIFIDDYAHHPTEIKATLDALRGAIGNKKMVVLFQPHRYSRVKAAFDEFGCCFDKADKILLTDIYSASEKEVPELNEKLFNHLSSKYPGKVVYYPRETFVCLAVDDISDSDYVISLGAGDINKALAELADKV